MYSTYVPMLLLSQEPVDWVEGDNIVIAPTSKDGNETEVSDLCTCGLTTWCNVPFVLYPPFDIVFVMYILNLVQLFCQIIYLCRLVLSNLLDKMATGSI